MIHNLATSASITHFSKVLMHNTSFPVPILTMRIMHSLFPGTTPTSIPTILYHPFTNIILKIYSSQYTYALIFPCTSIKFTTSPNSPKLSPSRSQLCHCPTLVCPPSSPGVVSDPSQKTHVSALTRTSKCPEFDLDSYLSELNKPHTIYQLNSQSYYTLHTTNFSHTSSYPKNPIFIEFLSLKSDSSYFPPQL